jgi:hypothetical protein
VLLDLLQNTIGESVRDVCQEEGKRIGRRRRGELAGLRSFVEEFRRLEAELAREKMGGEGGAVGGFIGGGFRGEGARVWTWGGIGRLEGVGLLQVS